MCDRNQGGSINKQWHQREGTVFPTGILIHQVHFKDLYDSGYVGWFRTSTPLLRRLQKSTLAEIMEPQPAAEDDAQYQ